VDFHRGKFGILELRFLGDELACCFYISSHEDSESEFQIVQDFLMEGKG
jgi:hypothetical protein